MSNSSTAAMPQEITLETENHPRDAAFAESLHGRDAEKRVGFWAMMTKDTVAKKIVVQDYFKHWDGHGVANETDKARQARQAEYATLTKHYYDLVTDFYEYGWGQSFHFCRFAFGEPFKQAMARHEHYLSSAIGLRSNMKVLDVGCGVGGPAREIVKFSGATVVGLNNNDYQISRANHYAEREGLSHKLSYVKGDFMQMPFADNSFDAVYVIEATVHAPSLREVYSEIQRVLKPGGVFGVYEWLLTDRYDKNNLHHHEIRLGIQQGSGISHLHDVRTALAAMEAADFELEIHEDLADSPDLCPWYWPLTNHITYLSTLFDVFTLATTMRLGRQVMYHVTGILETFRLAPYGTQKTAGSLNRAADCLVAGGKEKIFTPMYLMVGRKRKR